ncbi:type II secretion system secretin GspD [Bradymonas sediminis]|nr:type II secretion system secretin GspD [Bradymonas sediminis]
MGATLFAGALVPSEAAAQENKPGVIERDAPATNEAEKEAPAAAPKPARSSGETVITPDNVSPDERFNLPANFDTNYRPKRTPRNTRVTLDFRQAQLAEVVKFFAAAMNKNFIIADNLQANKTITIISPEEVSLAEAYRAFVAALEMNGLTLVPFGQFTKIIDSKKAISEPSPTYGEGERLPNLQRMVTAIVPVENSSPEEMQGIISKFVSSSATIIPYGSSLIITENASNLTRIRDLIKRLDLDEAQEQVHVYEVQYAEAADIQAKLTEIFGAGDKNQTAAQRKAAAAKKGDSGSDLNVQISQIIADERTNKLIILANPRDFGQIKSMIELLDVPTAVGGQVHVKFLEYAAAEEIASALSGLSSGSNRQQTTRRGRAPAPAPTNQVAALLDGEVQITAYTPNNALIVTAAPKDFVALESVIDRLDRPRKQVYVEAVILEIAMDTNSKLGMGFSAVSGKDYDGIIPDSAQESGLIDNTQGGIIGQSNFKGLASLFGGALGGTIGLIGPIATIPGTEISLPAFALTLMATQTDSAVNLLSAPAVMTMDNEEAEIVVADRVPFVTGIASGLSGLSGLAGLAGGSSGAAGLGALGGLGGLISPVQYEDVGITLRILPQINESSYVRLEIDQEVSDLKGASTESNPTPTRTKRSIKTVVLVEDQATVVLGGLMKESETKTVTKVPFLGDIPLLGFLFRDTGTRKVKQNLVLMLTPYIIESKSDIQKIYDRKMEERKELSKLLKIDSKDYIRNVNFQKKTGLVDRMRSTLREAQLNAAAREAAAAAFENQGPRYQILGSQGKAGQPKSNANDDSQGNPEQP